MSAKLFTYNDDELLKELYSSRTNKELVQIFNGQYSSKQIKWRAKSLKLHKDSETTDRARQQKSGAWEAWEEGLMKRHYAKDGLQYISKIITERSLASIKAKAGRMGLLMDINIRSFANGPKHHSTASREKMSVARKGKAFSESHKENLRLACKKGVEHPHYNPNRIREYDFGFTSTLKNRVFKRDKYKCVLCRKNKKILAHHIDYTKSNNVEENLITLCYSCHMKHHYHVTEEKKAQEKSLFESLARHFKYK
jgi:hypothetical protein